MTSSREIGSEHEKNAKDYLRRNGIKVIETNFYSPYGEIDIIGIDRQKTLIFFEVRYRRNQLYGTPQETISRAKINKIIKTAQSYLNSHHQYINNPQRFDVLAITGNGGSDINWITNAFDA